MGDAYDPQRNICHPTVKLMAIQSGAIAFFTKPFDDNQFLGAVRGALAMHPVE